MRPPRCPSTTVLPVRPPSTDSTSALIRAAFTPAMCSLNSSDGGSTRQVHPPGTGTNPPAAAVAG